MAKLLNCNVAIFEDEFPQAAKYLMEVYSQPPTFPCEVGQPHYHYFPHRIHVGVDFCCKIPHHP